MGELRCNTVYYQKLTSTGISNNMKLYSTGILVILGSATTWSCTPQES